MRLDYIRTASVACDVRHALSNSFGSAATTFHPVREVSGVGREGAGGTGGGNVDALDELARTPVEPWIGLASEAPELPISNASWAMFPRPG